MAQFAWLRVGSLFRSVMNRSMLEEACGCRRCGVGRIWSLVFPLAVTCCAIASHGADSARSDFVIHISVDGLRPDVVTVLGPTNLPNFFRLRAQGAFTDNARTDFDFTDTIPNHTTQLTGRGVLGPAGHNWTDNDDPASGVTLASNKGAYVAGAFDVAHDHGLRTALFASKSKFSLFTTSWNATNGLPDTTGPDDGRNKLDAALILYASTNATSELVNAFLTNMAAQPFHYAFVHLADPDIVGHNVGWDVTPGSAYCQSVQAMDALLGLILDRVGQQPNLTGRTAIILTSDHGGLGRGHDNPYLREDYTVPFYVWGPGVMSGTDLYALNPLTRLDPATNRPSYTDPVQPIRNGEAANLALRWLGLPPVPGSTINPLQDLACAIPPPGDFLLTLADGKFVLRFTTLPNVLYDVERAEGSTVLAWSTMVSNLAGTGGLITTHDPAATTNAKHFYRLRIHF